MVFLSLWRFEQQVVLCVKSYFIDVWICFHFPCVKNTYDEELWSGSLMFNFFVILNNLWFFHCWWGLTTLFNRNTLVRNLLYYVLADPLLSEPWNHQSVKVAGKIFQYFWRENQPVWRSLPPVRRLPASERPHPSYETNSEPEKWIIFVRLVVVSWRWSIVTCLI